MLKACFRSFRGCDSICETSYDPARKSLARSFDQEDSESSSDSEEEILLNMEKAAQRSNHGFLGDAQQQSRVFNQVEISASEQPSPTMSDRGQSLQTEVMLEQRSSDDQHQSEVDESLIVTYDQNIDLNDEQDSFQSSNLALDERNWAMVDTESEMSRDIPYSSFADEDDFQHDPSIPLPEAPEEEDVPMGVAPISACGTLDLGMQYLLSERKMLITVINAKDLPTKDRGGATIIQVRVVVLPAKKKRYKTKVQHVSSPHFGETFKMSSVSPEDLRGLGLRVRLYGIGKMRDRLIGEATVRFDELNIIADPQLTVTLQLEPRTNVNRGDPEMSTQAGEVSSMKRLAFGGSEPQILLSLSYNKMTGRLGVEVVKGSHFLDLSVGKPPDTHVKLVLLNSSLQEMAQSKTTVRRAQPNPVFKETFYFQVALFQLAEVSLMVSVYCNHTIKRKTMLGWISLGRNSSGEADEQHWVEMQEANGKAVNRWHTLIES
ncbi:unnamed protein product [Clavelina lepadiformis]|uniref:C2 domain-containing protein n=1 Tax=Clavelina lepadiformis TaxID=159417 RepID=A0ABP0FX45_CLALP